MKLYLFEHRSICFRVRMAAALDGAGECGARIAHQKSCCASLTANAVVPREGT
jgi:hypothetical protein